MSVNSMEKENSNNGIHRGRSGSLFGANANRSGHRAAPPAPGRRAKRQLPRTSTNPFLPQTKFAGKRSRRRRQPKFPVLSSQDDPVEMSRYLEDFEEVSHCCCGNRIRLCLPSAALSLPPLMSNHH